MKKRKGYLMFICVLILGCILLTGCGKKTVSEAQLKEDLSQSSAYTLYGDGLDMSIDSFKVTKRQTATEDRIDTAWVEVDSSSDAVTGHMYFVMTYELYNDGWQITNVEEDEIDEWYFTPLREMTDEEIATYISEDVQIVSKDVDLDEGTEFITYTWVESHEYCDVTYVRQDYFEFGTSNMIYDAGKWNYITTNDVGSTEEWNIVGTWEYEDTNHLVRLTIDDFQPDSPLFAYCDNEAYTKFNMDGYIEHSYNYIGQGYTEKAQGPFTVTYNKDIRYSANEGTASSVNNSEATLGYEFCDVNAIFLITYDGIIYYFSTYGGTTNGYELNKIE